MLSTRVAWAGLLALGSLLVAGPAAAARNDTAGWLRLETEGFTYFSNAGKSKTKAIAHELEIFRAAAGRVFPALADQGIDPTAVYLFNSEKSFRSYATEREVMGFFTGLPRRGNFIAANVGAVEPFPIIYHEYVHHLLRSNFPGVPLWLNEGLAAYFETFRVERGRAKLGLAHRGLASHLRNEPWMSLSEVLRVTNGSEAYRDPEASRGFRAQAWVLTRYLLEAKPDRGERTYDFLRLLAAGESSESALTQAFGMNLEELQAELRKAIGFEDLSYRFVSTKELQVGEVPETEPIGELEVLCRLGDLLLVGEAPRIVRGDELFAAALAVEPQYVPALLGRATAALRLGDHEKALPFAERAVALEPGNPLAQFLLGDALLRQFDAGGGEIPARGAPTPELVLRARRAYQETLKIDPLFLRAYNQLAHTYLFAGESIRPGIDLARKVLDRFPDLTLAVTLVELYSKAGDRESARRVYDEEVRSMQSSRGEEDTGWVTRAVERADLLTARAWASDGRYEEAIRLLEELRDRSSDEELRQDAESRIGEYRGRAGSGSGA